MAEDYHDLDEQTCVELGLTGYCFIVCEILLELHPTAKVWKLYKGLSDFSHIYLIVEGRPLDIKGFRDVDEMKTDLGEMNLIEASANWPEVLAFFHHPTVTTPGERKFVKNKLTKYIKDHIDLYTLPN